MRAAPPWLGPQPGRIGLQFLVVCTVLFLVLPVLIVVPISLSTSQYLTFPPRGLSLEWYQRVFGFTVLKRWNTTTMVGRGSMKVGLFLRPQAAPIADINQTIAITHVAFLVDGDKFDDAVKKVQAMGLKIEGPEDTGIAFSFFVNDPDGHLIEVTTYHPLPPADPPQPKRGP